MSESTTPTATAPTAPPKKTKRGPRGGVYDPFPMKVHRMLHQSRLEGNESVVSWLPHGRAFKIHQPKVFAEVIMPRFFNQSKYTSFQRQLNLYGFNRLTRGSDAGSYYHNLFLRGKPSLATQLLRQKVKGSGHKTMKLLDEEPDFYAMPPIVAEKEDGMVTNVFAGSPKFLPVTAVGALVPSTAAQVLPSMIAAPLVPRPAPLSIALSVAVKRPNMLLSSPRTIVSTSSASDSDSDESHQNHVSVSNQNHAAPESQQLRAVPTSQPARAPPARLVSSCESVTNHTSTASHGDPSFVNELNETIFMHELAMGCSILCQLRRGDSNL
ncbi:hypothetical protein ACHAWO_013963 [Cyclotella atomus]|uniref:HSF-type DNA-binding domain-containing protein n=1 Tax=Cyclotella atomus TaxID=382360 RepID=A0ABD3MUU7_9STRA